MFLEQEEVERYLLQPQPYSFSSYSLKFSGFYHVCCFYFAALEFRTEFACFTEILDIHCADNEVIVFDRATFGRSDQMVARECRVTHDDACKIDATSKLKRECAGRSRCSLHVNAHTFSDPCGEEEFVIVQYQCIKRECCDI